MDKILANKIFEQKQVFNEGKRGIVYISTINKKQYLIKQRKPESTSPGTIKNEYEYNKKLNEIGVGPNIYYYDEERDFLIRDFVDGIKIEDWVKEQENKDSFKTDLKKLLMDILNQARKMDLKKINKQELTNPHKDILITNQNIPIIIDFERCRFTNKPKNVTQFLQYLTRPFMAKTLNKVNIALSKDEIIVLGELYKQDLSEKQYLNIVSILK
jgi:putative serine/threonine protein kinase